MLIELRFPLKYPGAVKFINSFRKYDHMTENKIILSGKPLAKAQVHTDCMLKKNLSC